MDTQIPIVLNAVWYNHERRITMEWSPDRNFENIVNQLPDCQWSEQIRCWHVPNNPESLREIFRIFQGKAYIDTSGVFGEKRKNTKVIALKERPRETESHDFIPPTLSEVSMLKVREFVKWLEQRRYSENTVRNYVEGISTFLRYHHSKSPEEITLHDLEEFNHRHILKKGYSSSYQNLVINAVKLFFRKMEKREMDIEQIERPRKEEHLPNVLSKKEVKDILGAPVNLKHRVMLSLIYACGLRRSELLNLKPSDIGSNRGLLVIRQSKGNKDRVVSISVKMIEMLREYFKAYRPKTWLFEGQVAGEQYSPTSLQEVLKKSVAKAGIRKPVTLHWLRHSYATHLLESGTDLRYIQELLGHKSSRTTEIYTHVSQKNIQQIKSPFDDL
jgi:integrase/recombinase XerD